MSETVVDRVARAILVQDAKLWGGPLAGRVSWAFRSYARAAIAAMREPTEEMEAAATPVIALSDIWRAMIDAALEPVDDEEKRA